MRVARLRLISGMVMSLDASASARQRRSACLQNAGSVGLVALEYQHVLVGEADGDRLPALWRRQARVVKGIERDRIRAEAHADARDRAQEAHLLDDAAHPVALAAGIGQRYRLRAQRYQARFTRLRVADAAPRDDLLIVDGDLAARGIGHPGAQDV